MTSSQSTQTVTTNVLDATTKYSGEYGDIHFSEVSPSVLLNLFGEVRVYSNNFHTAIDYRVNADGCGYSCPKGQCDRSSIEPIEYDDTLVDLDYTGESTECRRVAATYLRSKTKGINNGIDLGVNLTGDQIREVEDPCGLPVICSAASFGPYPYYSYLYLNVHKDRVVKIVGDNEEGVAVVNISPDMPSVPCSLSHPSYYDLVPEKVIYVDGNCDDFRANKCLHEGNGELGQVTLSGNKIVNNEILEVTTTQKGCREPECGYEYCREPSTEECNSNITPDKYAKSATTSIITTVLGFIAFCVFLEYYSFNLIEFFVNLKRKYFKGKNDNKTPNIQAEKNDKKTS